ncbi:MAG: hypothetical protein ACOZNI_27220 [Myxococcota bacterium]
MTSQQLILHVVSGGVLGLLGQAMRTIIGLKKLNDEAAGAGKSAKELFDGTQLFSSLLIGFTAGALTMGFTYDTTVEFTKETIAILVGAGYAGTDAIEALMKRYLPGGSPPAGNTGAQPPAQTPAALPAPANRLPAATDPEPEPQPESTDQPAYG